MVVKNKFLYIVWVAFVLHLAFDPFGYFEKYYRQIHNEQVLNLSFYGKVERMYVDKPDHNCNKLVLSNSETVIASYTGFYEMVSVGDSVCKNKGEGFIRVIKIDTIMVFNLYLYKD